MTRRPDTSRPLRVAIDARLRHGESGGVESVVLGLAEGLSTLGGDDDYLFLTVDGEDNWIKPHLRGRTRAIPVRARGPRGNRRLRRVLKSVSAARWAARTLNLGRQHGPPRSDGTVERLGADVVHLVHQWGFTTRVPSIYHPHDLQHRHLPDMFDRMEREARDRWYSTLAHRASAVAVASSWTRDDVVRQLDVPATKVHVVPWAPPLQAVIDGGSNETRQRITTLGLPERYLLYPAQTWPHKNHTALLEALALIRDRDGVAIPLVLTGRRNEQAAAIDERIRALQLTSEVRWLGFLEPVELHSVLAGAHAVVIPSKFEAASGPLWEAFAAGVPAACSNVTSLPAQAGDAALVFDPYRTDQIAASVLRLWSDDALRAALAVRGRAKVAKFTWNRTARHFRALYRLVAGAALSDTDRGLLTEDPMI